MKPYFSQDGATFFHGDCLEVLESITTDNPHLRDHINGGNGGRIIAHETERRVVVPNAGGRWPANPIPLCQIFSRSSHGRVVVFSYLRVIRCQQIMEIGSNPKPHRFFLANSMMAEGEVSH
jgi:hypothetical protein